MKHLNIEIKARCADQESIRSILRERSAEYKGLDHQIDTYFKASNGRLKLREGNIENHLIFYARENKAGPKQSDIILFKNNPGSSLKSILERSLGVLMVVDKKREIYFIDNVKFHIDSVEGLGSFIEIEAIDSDGTISRETLLKQCSDYLKLFGVEEKDLVPVSYSDMLLEKTLAE